MLWLCNLHHSISDVIRNKPILRVLPFLWKSNIKTCHECNPSQHLKISSKDHLILCLLMHQAIYNSCDSKVQKNGYSGVHEWQLKIQPLFLEASLQESDCCCDDYSYLLKYKLSIYVRFQLTLKSAIGWCISHSINSCKMHDSFKAKACLTNGF